MFLSFSPDTAERQQPAAAAAAASSSSFSFIVSPGPSWDDDDKDDVPAVSIKSFIKDDGLVLLVVVVDGLMLLGDPNVERVEVAEDEPQ